MKVREGHWHAIVIGVLLCIAAYNLVTTQAMLRSPLLNPLFFLGWLGTSTLIVLVRSELRVRSEYWYLNESGKKDQIRLERKKEMLPLGLAGFCVLAYSIKWFTML